ncbi:MAG: GNAT family N-acetyltransferase [Anaerolineae bacterium]|nr:GNAT family N-acetyltransferase [Anaerolineae bacterium]
MAITWEDKPLPEVALRRLWLADAPRAHALSRLVGWSLTLASWERMILWGGRGCFALYRGDALVATAIATVYGRERAWIGGVITHPDHRRQGLATRLMTVALDYLQARSVPHVLLDASEQGRPLYEALGFRPIYSIEIWAGRASSYLGPRARPLRRGDLDAVVALDAETFGVARGRILRRLVQDYPHLAWVDEEDGRIAGFLLAQDDRQDGTPAHLGPWMHRSPWGAEKLLRTALSVLIGREVRVDIPDRNPHATALAYAHNLRHRRVCTRMHLGPGDPPPELITQHYGVAALATG